MLSLRIVTAIALIIPAVISLFFLSPFWVTAYFGLFIAAGAWEWTALIGMRRRAARAAYTIGVVALGAVLIAAGARAAMIVFFGATVFWTLALVELIRRPGVHQGWLHGPVARYVVGFAVLVPPLIAVYVLHDADRYRPMLLLFALVLVWIADSAAYFAGHFFGRTAASLSGVTTAQRSPAGSRSRPSPRRTRCSATCWKASSSVPPG
jgi:phosphatidate cytidylyltransferase